MLWIMRFALPVGILFLMFISSYAQEDRAVDFTRGDIRLRIDPVSERIEGNVEYRFSVLRKTDSVYLDAREMELNQVRINGREPRYSYDGRYLVISAKLRKNKDYTIEISYTCHPKQAVYFLGWKDSIPGNEQVWTQGQGKYNSHWVPSIDLMSEKINFNMEIQCRKGYEVIANGKLQGEEEGSQTRTWRWQMNRPMSSYLLAFAIGKYHSSLLMSSSGVPLHLYYYPQDSLLAEPTYRFSKGIFDLFEKEIGIAYPWQNYKVVPVRDFLYAGMENTGTTLFSDAYVIDSTAFADRNFIQVNAHELAHQWFGNLVTEKDASSHWLHEGFANYYAWLASKEFLGDDTFYWMLYDNMEALSEQNREGQGESLLDPNAGSLTFYDKGGLALIMLREYLGEEHFKKAIREFLTAFAFQNATVHDFLKSTEISTGSDLSGFRKTWLESTDFPREEIIAYLTRSYAPIADFLRLKKELIATIMEDERVIRRYWDDTSSSEFRKRLILLYHRSLSDEFLLQAFKTQDPKVRQALAAMPGPIPTALLPDYESLLEDHSYITLENALYKLWLYQPGNRATYLDQTRGIIGFPSKNIRQLWLLLAILTRDYGTEADKEDQRKEVFGYTARHYPMQVRQLAFSLIGEVFTYPPETLRDLINAAVHPSWQFREFARNILKSELEDPGQRRVLELISDELIDEEYSYLSKQLNRQ